MSDAEELPNGAPKLPASSAGGMTSRALLNIGSGAIPLVGGILSAFAGAWGEKEQERVNRFIEHWLKMFAEEMKEKERTMKEIVARLDIQDDEIAKRVESTEYQALLRKAFGDWAGTESEEKRVFIRNVLVNAAATTLTSDDVVKLFLQWIKDYSEFHFAVVTAIYNSSGITRGEVWNKIGRPDVREDSAEADLFKLLFRDLSTGGIIRQHRDTDYAGNFIPKKKKPPTPKGTTKPMMSAFDDNEGYELTALGQQFVHYAMSDLPPKVTFSGE